MGHTHYWRTTRRIPPSLWRQIAEDVRKLVADPPCTLWHEYDEPGTAPVIGAKTIWFNGAGDEGHESFVFDSLPTEFTFCKTARKPYDVVVCAVLAVIAEHAAGIVTVTSDGDPDEWQPGLDYAKRILGRAVPCPIKPE